LIEFNTQNSYKQLTLYAVRAALAAGRRIMAVYDQPIEVDYKEDRSPLTAADRAAHTEIADHLRRQTPDIPILSEEGKEIDYEVRRNWERFWLVDPLDGTKEFIKRNGEFTVNIALIESNISVLGVIYVPCRNHLYFACPGAGANKIENITAIQPVTDFDHLLSNANPLPLQAKRSDRLRVVGSRSHASQEFEKYIKELKNKHKSIEITPAGSSLKFCLVAEGKADLYPRLSPTMEWDTAAGQAIAEQAGCTVVNLMNSKPIKYNKKDLRNSFFIVPFGDWEKNPRL
jgi:3'(2'), 5'-bisphosphate nucleotidase